MYESYDRIMNRYEQQLRASRDKPEWRPPNTKNSKEPSDLIVTHVNQANDLLV